VKLFLQSDGPRADILRTIVVFLHATFEDVLRTAARQRIIAAKADVLNEIPLVGAARSDRREKFGLGSLDPHRGKTVDQLSDESVQDYLNTKSISSCADVDKVLRQCGLEARPFRRLYPPLNQMMKRRHRIVHQADLSGPSARASHSWTVADTFELMMWLVAVPAFYSLLRGSLDPTDKVQCWNYRKLLRAMDGIGEFGKRLLDVANSGPAPESQMEAFCSVSASMRAVAAVLKSRPKLFKVARRNERRSAK
jgi:hypothetical protein